MLDLVTTLREAGLTTIDCHVSPPRLPFDPVGVGLHHTAAPEGVSSLQYILDHRLCNILIGRDLICYVITDGHASHFGLGHPSVLARTRAGLPPVPVTKPMMQVTGNAWYFGIEIENNGTTELWPQALIDTSVKTAAAICRAMGWNENVVVLHKEWAPWRKVDPKWADGPTWRALVRDCLATSGSVEPEPEQQEDDVTLRFVKRKPVEGQEVDPRVYVSDGIYKRRMKDWDMLEATADRLHIFDAVEDWDAKIVNEDLVTIGDDV